MQDNIHPNYHQVTVKCACGAQFTTGTTLNVSTLKVAICSQCHPFFTGEMKFVDTMGRIEKFQAKQKLAQQLAQKKTNKKKKRSANQPQRPRTLKEMLNQSK